MTSIFGESIGSSQEAKHRAACQISVKVRNIRGDVPKSHLSHDRCSVAVSAPFCSIPQRVVRLSEALQAQRERLQDRLAEQINSLPVGNESWLQTERELVAAERALHQLDGRCQLVI